MIRREGIDKIRLDIGVDWAIPSPLLFLPQTEPSPHSTFAYSPPTGPSPHPTSVLLEWAIPSLLFYTIWIESSPHASSVLGRLTMTQHDSFKVILIQSDSHSLNSLLYLLFYCFPFYIHFSIVFHLWKPPLQNLYKPPHFPPKGEGTPNPFFPPFPIHPLLFLSTQCSS